MAYYLLHWYINPLTMLKQLLLLTAAILTFTVHSKAQQTVQKFIRETPYLVYLPQGYTADSTKNWPLLIFLHGSGESGNDIEKVKKHGPPKLIEGGKQFPFIVVSPQANSGRGWQTDVLEGMIADIRKKYRVDNDRVYLTGLSMGGFGSWNLATSSPQLFAAIAPICGGGDADKAWRLRNVPVWCFHGAKDNVVPLSASQTMVDAVKPLNPGVKFTIYPDAGHDSWTEAYNNDSLYTWLLAQKRFQYKQVPVAEAQLKKYEGTYVGMNNDTVRITLESGKLVASPPKGRIEIKPASETIFYINENAFDYVEFNSTGFVVAGDKKQPYKRIK